MFWAADFIHKTVTLSSIIQSIGSRIFITLVTLQILVGCKAALCNPLVLMLTNIFFLNIKKYYKYENMSGYFFDVPRPECLQRIFTLQATFSKLFFSNSFLLWYHLPWRLKYVRLHWKWQRNDGSLDLEMTRKGPKRDRIANWGFYYIRTKSCPCPNYSLSIQ